MSINLGIFSKRRKQKMLESLGNYFLAAIALGLINILGTVILISYLRRQQRRLLQPSVPAAPPKPRFWLVKGIGNFILWLIKLPIIILGIIVLIALLVPYLMAKWLSEMMDRLDHENMVGFGFQLILTSLFVWIVQVILYGFAWAILGEPVGFNWLLIFTAAAAGWITFYMTALAGQMFEPIRHGLAAVWRFRIR
ncbi:hypothetical protein A2Z33_01800 [Candidatus Gottesmanbacteria bacterium RBG_16_52_11]|uniref:Uncharacterized protein n=1 Tax=Candidatus Gottesmanbacteria bacterium RBG_16_52_11 TaxID=1798374 RepID=A0A1F5YRK5_9BACT|nr:MAG: hypothetical protein A2Z33_01800 [Candidatus Gottesmanbacteria bacterium RBG_16_52_11]